MGVKTFVKFHSSALIWALSILVLLFIPTGGVKEVETRGIDKLLHFTMFAMLCYLALSGHYKKMRFSPNRISSLKFVLLACLIYSIVTETLHLFISYRSFDWFDMLANATGCVIGFIYFRLFVIKQNQHDPK